MATATFPNPNNEGVTDAASSTPTATQLPATLADQLGRIEATECFSNPKGANAGNQIVVWLGTGGGSDGAMGLQEAVEFGFGRETELMA